MEYRLALHLQRLYRLAELLRGQAQSAQFRLDMYFVTAVTVHLICVIVSWLDQAHRIQLVVPVGLLHL
jgi:hypothetical protein